MDIREAEKIFGNIISKEIQEKFDYGITERNEAIIEVMSHYDEEEILEKFSKEQLFSVICYLVANNIDDCEIFHEEI